MKPPSARRPPLELVSFTLSLPARSMRFMVDTVVFSERPFSGVLRISKSKDIVIVTISAHDRGVPMVQHRAPKVDTDGSRCP